MQHLPRIEEKVFITSLVIKNKKDVAGPIVFRLRPLFLLLDST